MKTLKMTLLMAALMVAGVSIGQITGTKHDFGAAAWNTFNYSVGVGEDQICKVCHTPHNAMATYVPLWNHEVSATAAYTVYSNSTFDGGPAGQPDGVSKMCLGCHDASSATNAFDNFVGVATTTTQATGVYNLGSDLSNDHPVSFVYNAALSVTDPDLYDPTTVEWNGVGSGTIDAKLLDASDKVQCSSCHNPHDGTFGKFLRKTNTGSQLCLTCHNK